MIHNDMLKHDDLVKVYLSLPSQLIALTDIGLSDVRSRCRMSDHRSHTPASQTGDDDSHTDDDDDDDDDDDAGEDDDSDDVVIACQTVAHTHTDWGR